MNSYKHHVHTSKMDYCRKFFKAFKTVARVVYRSGITTEKLHTYEELYQKVNTAVETVFLDCIILNERVQIFFDWSASDMTVMSTDEHIIKMIVNTVTDTTAEQEQLWNSAIERLVR